MPVARVRTKKRNTSAPSSAPSSTGSSEPAEEAAGPESKLTRSRLRPNCGVLRFVRQGWIRLPVRARTASAGHPKYGSQNKIKCVKHTRAHTALGAVSLLLPGASRHARVSLARARPGAASRGYRGGGQPLRLIGLCTTEEVRRRGSALPSPHPPLPRTRVAHIHPAPPLCLLRSLRPSRRLTRMVRGPSNGRSSSNIWRVRWSIQRTSAPRSRWLLRCSSRCAASSG